MDVLYTVALVLGVSALAGWIVFFTGEKRVLRRLRALPVVAVRDAVDGQLVRITGKLRPIGEPLLAPLSGRPCSYYLAIADQVSDDGFNVSEERGQDFLIEDATGRALVRFAGARVAIDKDRRQESGINQVANSSQESFLARHGQKSHGSVFKKSIVYTEGVLEAGELVSVAGVALLEPDSDPRLVLQARPKMPLLISDQPAIVS